MLRNEDRALDVERVIDQRRDAGDKAPRVGLLGMALERGLVDPMRVDEEKPLVSLPARA